MIFRAFFWIWQFDRWLFQDSFFFFVNAETQNIHLLAEVNFGGPKEAATLEPFDDVTGAKMVESSAYRKMLFSSKPLSILPL